MTGLVYAIGMVLFLLGVLASIALHEVGHMVPAKHYGVKVTQYFVGFGKTVWSRQKGDTEYGVKAIPMGGFIRMIGMLPPAKRDADGRIKGIQNGFFGGLIADARAHEVEQSKDADEDRLFYLKPWWQKVIIMAGGPMMNIFLAIFLLGIVIIGFGLRTPTMMVDQVSQCVIPASEGERACKATDQVAPANEAGFKAGDEIVSFNGQPVDDWDEFTEDVRANGSGAATVVVIRDGRQLTLTTDTTISQRLKTDSADEYVEVGFLGLTPTEVREQGTVADIGTVMWDYTRHTGEALTHMPQRMYGVFEAAFGLDEREQNSPMSVVGAGRVAGEVASDDSTSKTDRWAALLTLLAVVNLFVALFNFIPLLPLDGGHIAGALYEGARRGIARLRGRPDPGYVDVAQLLPVAYAAASILIVMGVLLVWADIFNPIRLTG